MGLLFEPVEHNGCISLALLQHFITYRRKSLIIIVKPALLNLIEAKSSIMPSLQVTNMFDHSIKFIYLLA